MNIEIKNLLNTYEKTSAKRLEKLKKIYERELRKEKREEKFRSDFKKIIVQEVRPYMKELLRCIEKQFTWKVDTHDEFFLEQYMVKSKKEKNVDFFIALQLKIEQEKFEEKVMFCTGWGVDDDTEHYNKRKYKLNEITNLLLKKTFMRMRFMQT